MMLKRFLHRMMMAVMLSGGVSLSAYAFVPASQFGSVSGTQSRNTDMLPAYSFKSTSAYSPVVGSSPYSSEIYSPGAKSPSYRPNRVGGYWNEDGEWVPEQGDNPVGEVDDPLPVGEPWILLVMASVYLLCILVRRNLSKVESRKSKA